MRSTLLAGLLAAAGLVAAGVLVPGPGMAVHECGAAGLPARGPVEAGVLLGDHFLDRFLDDTPTAVTYRLASVPGAPFLGMEVAIHAPQGHCAHFSCNDAGGNGVLQQCSMPAGEHVVTVWRAVNVPAGAYVLTALCGPLATPC